MQAGICFKIHWVISAHYGLFLTTLQFRNPQSEIRNRKERHEFHELTPAKTKLVLGRPWPRPINKVSHIEIARRADTKPLVFNS